MSLRANVGIVVLEALAIAAGAAYWLHERSAATPAAIASESIGKDRSGGKPESASNPAEPDKATKKGSPATSVEAKKKDASVAEPSLSPRTGEILDYSADVAKVSNVANLRLVVAERRNFVGKNAWHLQAFAHTQNPLRMVFELDDQFDSYSDAGSMTSLQYEMHLNERGQKVDSVQRMSTTGKEPAPPNASETVVPAGTRDPLGMMQYLRTVDWSQKHEVRGPVYDGHKLYDVLASLASPSEAVTVPTGSYKANKIDIRVFADGAEMKDAHFALYLAHDDARTPVLLEAILPWTTARVGLKTKQ